MDGEALKGDYVFVNMKALSFRKKSGRPKETQTCNRMWRKEHVTGRNGALEILVKGFLRNLGISLRGREAKRAEAVFGVCVCVCVGTCQVASVVSNSLRPHGLKVKVAQSCLTLCDPMDYAVHGILQARILELVTFPFPRGSSQPRN